MGSKRRVYLIPHLDDMQCAFATLKGFLKGYHEKICQCVRLF